MSKRLQSWWLFSVEIFAGVGAIVHMSAYIIAVGHLLKDDTLYLWSIKRQSYWKHQNAAIEW